ncbi:hypothetical protein [Thermogemmatispora carboxidivorans]|uniref:hypothetical protein n=1 Tax=Thermogemmatispora carboxidivorans TaxID=1382306 RepID=UPI0012DC662E|nr:hypothetical protein [Thermogemmatispora carboxidivorans]
MADWSMAPCWWTEKYVLTAVILRSINPVVTGTGQCWRGRGPCKADLLAHASAGEQTRSLGDYRR